MLEAEDIHRVVSLDRRQRWSLAIGLFHLKFENERTLDVGNVKDQYYRPYSETDSRYKLY